MSYSKLAKLFPGSEKACPRCKGEKGTLGHMFWGCQKLQAFWRKSSESWNIKISPNPLTAIFGIVCQVCNVSTWQASAMAFSKMMACRRILLSWKKATPPSQMEDLLSHLKVEQQRRVAQGSANTFYKIWQLFLSHIKRLPDNSL